jgi:hypothetical protein
MSSDTLFQHIDLAQIDAFIKDKQEENLHLEFKTIEHAELSKNDKKIFAKALSGFANSSGGVVIWGVEARKNNEGIDCATTKQPISPLSMFISRLNELTGEFVDPLVDGVQHKKIQISEDEGFAVTLVPASDSGPHMAKGGEDRYYKRSGDSFYKMEHFDSEDMFGRRKKPKLSLYTNIREKRENSQIIIGIINEGRGVAKAPYLAFSVDHPFHVSPYGLTGSHYEGLPALRFTGGGLQNRYGAGSDFVIHPGTILEVTKLEIGILPTPEQAPKQDIKIEYAIIAEDVQMVRDTKILRVEEFG